MLASNIGGTATLIGDPPNIIIGAQVGLSFNSFMVNLAPVIGVILVIHTLAIHVIWGRKLHATPEARERIMAMDERKAISDRTLLIKSLIVISGGIGRICRSAFHRHGVRNHRHGRGRAPASAG